MTKDEEAEDESPRRKLPVVIRLSKPIHDGEKEISEVKFTREPTGGDMSVLPMTNPTLGDFLRVVMKVTGIPVPILKKMTAKDSMEVTGVIGDFLD